MPWLQRHMRMTSTMNLTTITDALGNIRNFTYDGIGSRIDRARPPCIGRRDVTAHGRIAYDDASNIDAAVDPRSQTTNFTYDALNRPLTEDYTGQSGTEVDIRI